MRNKFLEFIFFYAVFFEIPSIKNFMFLKIFQFLYQFLPVDCLRIDVPTDEILNFYYVKIISV